ncbi:uncharacterized protein LOC115213966 [Octopus sinensis]|uniref:Uncharacterized protein LOC115213966 n=1 Tax=Octopus sinensis TaxID=2607531 RepID=A0A6P7SKN9_9MOLL|nr:uncharacterized protein LOC115213966 [Octopus sinensis]XP_036360692.1 uncharacterized protein LOC115213966 [Octopus sinensis]XP_036360693.1 uncharacterized protein LOC115213966 [Octopus sinensis]
MNRYTRFTIRKRLFVIVLCLTLPWYYISSYLQNFDKYESATGQCVLPNIDPFDESIKQFIRKLSPLQCSKNNDFSYLDNKGRVHLNWTAGRLLGFHRNQTYCVYNVINRYDDDDHILYQPARTVVFPMDIPSDFFRITCADESGSSYSNLHAHIFPTNITNEKVKKRSNPRKQYNVFIFGVDSVSRLNCLRMLPKTYKYLTQELGAFDFQGYTKVGDNTFPNMVPLLTGMHPYEESSKLPYVDPSYHFYDSYPLLWKNFSDAGYITMFAEDEPLLGIFNYLSKGFNQQPTDHYMRPFWLALDDTHPSNKFISPFLLMLENHEVQLSKSSTLCFGNIPKHVVLMNYYKYFTMKYKKTPRFGYSWLTELGHSHLNIVQLADNDFVNFLKSLKDNGQLDNSFLIFMSDHGHRFDSIRHTLIGRIEERMPLFLMTIPKGFKRDYPSAAANLLANTKRLTSPYDLHQTLKDILSTDYENNNAKRLASTKGVSLFSRISKQRSCADAGISENYCPCYKIKPLNTTENNVSRSIAKFILDKINSLLQPWRGICSNLKLNSIKSSDKIVPHASLREENGFFASLLKHQEPEEGTYTVVVETVPGLSLFEASVNYKSNTDISLYGEISRINRYGNQSDCIRNKRMKLYCYCIA